MLVRIEFQNAVGSIDTTWQTGVTIVSTGSGTFTPSSGFVSIVNGVGTISLRNFVAETITLSLLDSQNTGKLVSSTQTVTFTVGMWQAVCDPNNA